MSIKRKFEEGSGSKLILFHITVKPPLQDLITLFRFHKTLWSLIRSDESFINVEKKQVNFVKYSPLIKGAVVN